MAAPLALRGQIVFPDCIERATILVRDGRIAERLNEGTGSSPDATLVDAEDGFVAPGYVDLHVQADPEVPLREAHTLSGKVKGAIKAAVPGVAGVLIHMEPYEGEPPPPHR